MEQEILRYFLPEGLLDFFTITKVSETIMEPSKLKILQIDLEEKNTIPAGYDSKQYESKGFYPAKLIKDFPVRGKVVCLSIQRRRWRHKVNKSEIIHNDYSLFAKSGKLTQELSDFLKYTDRDA